MPLMMQNGIALLLFPLHLLLPGFCCRVENPPMGFTLACPEIIATVVCFIRIDSRLLMLCTSVRQVTGGGQGRSQFGQSPHIFVNEPSSAKQSAKLHTSSASERITGHWLEGYRASGLRSPALSAERARDTIRVDLARNAEVWRGKNDQSDPEALI
ncbi:hypothetical protein C8Q70DRAFT_1122552 [Cubamyces menziesii]|nr:hypothetical protein C8Q70DRAFT_1122552 [Cubamyces menziesii]